MGAFSRRVEDEFVAAPVARHAAVCGWRSQVLTSVPSAPLCQMPSTGHPSVPVYLPGKVAHPGQQGAKPIRGSLIKE
eukprot:7334877-Pyramimonas_sp.AAC.1